MAEFLKAFIPTFAFMLMPLILPALALAIGSIRDLIHGETRPGSVEDRLRARAVKNEIVTQEPAFDAA